MQKDRKTRYPGTFAYGTQVLCMEPFFCGGQILEWGDDRDSDQRDSGAADHSAMTYALTGKLKAPFGTRVRMKITTMFGFNFHSYLHPEYKMTT